MKLLNIIHYDQEFLARAGIKELLTEERAIRLLGSYEDKSEFLTAAEKYSPNVIVFDFTSKDSITSEDIKKISRIRNKPGFLVISHNYKKDIICEYMDCGVECFVTKSCSRDEILLAIKAAAKGEKFFCNKVLDFLIDRSFSANDNCDASNLTKREIEILKLTAEGYSNKSIADVLFLSLHTVYTHRKNIMKKLDIKSSSEFIKYAYDSGLATTKQ